MVVAMVLVDLEVAAHQGCGCGRGVDQGSDIWSEDGTSILNNGGYYPQQWACFTPQDQQVILQAHECE
jgi:hypothetical protein